MATGTPVTTLLEGGVANCFPGLEYDHRNLDRRFFPGLMFHWSSGTGAPLVKVDVNDPDLSPATFEGLPEDAPDATVQSALRTALNGTQGKALRQGSWFLDSIKQSGRTISVRNRDGMTIWRLVRCLAPRPVDIVLTPTPRPPPKIAPTHRRPRLVHT